jgi:FKBP-type peptidyl-prolyl cis-trans isomerase (trigger factor)
MTVDTPIQPWQLPFRNTYISVEQLMTARQSRRILRIPLFPNAETRKSFELAVEEVVDDNMLDVDDDENILQLKTISCMPYYMR